MTIPHTAVANTPSFLHRGDEHSRRFGEKPRRLEDDFGPGRNAERLDDNIDSSSRIVSAIDTRVPRVKGRVLDQRVKQQRTTADERSSAVHAGLKSRNT